MPASVVYTLLVDPWQEVVDPVIETVGWGLTDTASDDDAPLPQPFDPATVTLPGAVPKVTVMDVVPAPAVIIAPVGTVQR